MRASIPEAASWPWPMPRGMSPTTMLGSGELAPGRTRASTRSSVMRSSSPRKNAQTRRLSSVKCGPTRGLAIFKPGRTQAAALEQAPGSLHSDLDRQGLDVAVRPLHGVGDLVRAAIFRIGLVEDGLCWNLKVRAPRKPASLGLPTLQRQGPVLGRGDDLDLRKSPR